MPFDTEQFVLAFYDERNDREHQITICYLEFRRCDLECNKYHGNSNFMCVISDTII
jgi:hypothetical protein